MTFCGKMVQFLVLSRDCVPWRGLSSNTPVGPRKDSVKTLYNWEERVHLSLTRPNEVFILWTNNWLTGRSWRHSHIVRVHLEVGLCLGPLYSFPVFLPHS